MKKILIIGGGHLRYHSSMIAQNGFEVSHLKPAEALALVKEETTKFDLIVAEMYCNHGKELDGQETDGGCKTGVVLCEKLLPMCQKAKFIIFGSKGSLTPTLAKNPRVVSEINIIHFGLPDFLKIVEATLK